MSLGFLRFILGRVPLRPISHIIFPSSAVRPAWSHHRALSPLLRVSFCTDAESLDVADHPKETKKLDPRARVTFGSVGRKINQRHIRLLGEGGEELGTLHRAEVIRMMDETGLKLVAVNDSSDPPVYRLMRGKQIHEEQLKLREMQKAKTGPVQSKELNFSSDISHHDLDTKLRQVVSWLEKKNHVRLTIKAGSGSDTPLDKVLTQMVEKISLPVGFVSKPTVVRGGRAAMCVLRLASAKELRQKATETSNKQDLEKPKPPLTSTTEKSKD